MRIAAALLLALLFASEPILAQTELLNARVGNLEIRDSDHELSVSYKVAGTFTKDIIEKIQSGIETSFEHVIKIYKKVPMIPGGRTFLQRIIVTTVKYNTLTKQYSLDKKIDGAESETSVTDKIEDVEIWMTEIKDFKVGEIDTILGKKNYFLKIRVSLAPNFLLFFIPYDYSASKERELEF